MARPFKQGLQYFPMDVHIFKDQKLVDMHYYFGPLGLHLYTQLLLLVYENGYYLEKSEDELAAQLHRILGTRWVKLSKVVEMIRGCVEFNLLERELYTQGVITSLAIQKQYILSTKRRKTVNIDKYWLLDQEAMDELGSFLSMQKNRVNVCNNLVNVNNNPVNVDINTQREREIEKERDVIDIKDKSIYGLPEMHYLTKFLTDRKYIQQDSSDIVLYNKLFEEVTNRYSHYDVMVVVRYIVTYSRNAEPKIDDKFAFMKKSVINNLKEYKIKQGGESFEKWIESGFLQVDR
ncbi:MAG: DUF4373 domain-containing protein [Tenericutes bacterium]|nr:DUF4373 domain-containing protein [Mycoplasmatota bacterium]